MQEIGFTSNATGEMSEEIINEDQSFSLLPVSSQINIKTIL
jgi:hypothetical protein